MRDKTANKSVEVVINEALKPCWFLLILVVESILISNLVLSQFLWLPTAQTHQVLAETSWGRVEGDRWIIESTKFLGQNWGSMEQQTLQAF